MKKIKLCRLFSKESNIVISGISTSYYDNINKILNIFDLNNCLLEIDQISKDGEIFNYVSSNKISYYEVTIYNKLYIVTSKKHIFKLMEILTHSRGKNQIYNACIYRFLTTNGLLELMTNSEIREHILKDGISMFILIDFAKDIITIHVKNKFVSPEKVYEKVKMLELR